MKAAPGTGQSAYRLHSLLPHDAMRLWDIYLNPSPVLNHFLHLARVNSKFAFDWYESVYGGSYFRQYGRFYLFRTVKSI